MTTTIERTARTAATGGHQPGTADYRRVVSALFAAGVATFALIYSTQALLPELAVAFDVTPAQSSLSLSLTTLGLAVALLVAGPWSDVVGRTRLIHLSLPLATALAIGTALSPSWHAFLGLRLVEGVALAGLPAVATAFLREELHPSSHARVAGLYIGGTAIGGMVGRLVAGAVGEWLGWRWALGAIAAVAAVCALVVRLTLPQSRGFTAVPSGIRTVVGTARQGLRDPALLALFGIGGCSVGALVGLLNTLGFRLAQAPFGLGTGAASLVFLVYPVGTVSAAAFGRLADRHGRRAVLPFGVALALVGGLLTLASWLPLVVTGIALLTAGFFAAHGVASGWVPARAHAGGIAVGQAASLYLFSYYVGSSVFGSLAGQLWTTAGWPGVIGLTSVLLATAGALSIVLQRSEPLAPQAAATPVPGSR